MCIHLFGVRNSLGQTAWHIYAYQMVFIVKCSMPPKNKSETNSRNAFYLSLSCVQICWLCSRFSCLHLDSTLITAIYVSVFDLFGNVLKNIFQTKILVKQEKCDAFCIFALKFICVNGNRMSWLNQTGQAVHYPPICWYPCFTSNQHTHAAKAINFKWKISVDNFSFL